jgi:hypothetical protein
MVEYTDQMSIMGASQAARLRPANFGDERPCQNRAKATNGAAINKKTRLFMVVAISRASAQPNPSHRRTPPLRSARMPALIARM